jgi:hypothetical protein
MQCRKHCESLSFSEARRGFTMKSLAVIIMLISALGFAQNQTATVTGQVVDQSGAAVPGAKVVAINTATNGAHEAVTNNQGQYTIPLLPPGTYDVSAEASSFRKQVRSGAVLQVGQDARFDFTMSIGDTQEIIEVSASAPVIETETPSLGSVIDNHKVVEMPLNGRVFWNLALLVPGVYQSVTSNNQRGGMNVSGNGDGANNYTLDGINDNDFSISEPAFRPSVDAIQEFKVNTGTYEAEFGHNSGGQVIVVTKSGGNTFNGTLYEFLRNQAVDAKNFFTPAGLTPAYKRNQFGGTVGGPIKKNKTFFFFAYEGLRLRNQQTALSTVPTVAEQAGNFSGLPVTLKVPAGYASNAIVNNTINTAAFTPAQLQSYTVAKAILSFYPSPTIATPAGALPASNYNFSQTAQETSNLYSMRLDHSFGTRDTVYASLNYYNDTSINYYQTDPICGTLTLPGFQCLAGALAQLYGGGWTHVFTPTVINDFHGGFQRFVAPRHGVGPESQTDFEAKYGIPATASVTPYNFGIPWTTISSYNSIGDATNIPQYRADNTFDVQDGVLWSVGKHNFKFGAQSTRMQNNALVGNNARGQFNYTSTSAGPTTGYSLADALLGLPATAIRNPTAPPVELRTSFFAAYAQDMFKITQRLTLNYGLRWEDITPLSDNYPTIANFDRSTGTAYIVGQGNHPSNAYGYYNTAFAPRFGFAYQLFGNQDTVVRGGVGRYFNSPVAVNGFLNLEYAYPVRQNQQFTSNSTNPLSLPNPFVGPAGIFAAAGADPNFVPGVLSEWSLNIERKLAGGIVVEVGYIGTSGRHIQDTINLNQPAPSTLATTAVQASLPFPSFTTIPWYQSNGVSSYNALQLRLEKRYSNGLSFLTTYNYGKSLDNVSFTAENKNNLRGEYGPSIFDVRNRFVFSPVYELPFGRNKAFLQDGVAGRILGGFQVSGIVTAQSGVPLTPVMTGNFSNTNNQLLGNLDRPNVVSGIDPNNGPKTLQQWFNTSAFIAPAFGTFGNGGVGLVRAPGYTNFDLALSRRFPIFHEKSLQFRVEAFNALNHPNFSAPSMIVNSSTFGKITAANTPRDIQFGLKFVF